MVIEMLLVITACDSHEEKFTEYTSCVHDSFESIREEKLIH